MIQEAVTRIWRMEYCFDMLQCMYAKNPAALREDAGCRAMLECLISY